MPLRSRTQAPVDAQITTLTWLHRRPVVSAGAQEQKPHLSLRYVTLTRLGNVSQQVVHVSGGAARRDGREGARAGDVRTESKVRHLLISASFRRRPARWCCVPPRRRRGLSGLSETCETRARSHYVAGPAGGFLRCHASWSTAESLSL